jgi:hypothetical protein
MEIKERYNKDLYWLSTALPSYTLWCIYKKYSDWRLVCTGCS